MISNKTNEQNPILVIKNAVKRFGSLCAVDNISLEIPKGEIFSLLGPSGCGKTTLLRMIAGFEYPDKGDIILAGKRVNKLPPNKRECNIVFQQHALFPHLNVFDNIAFGLVEKRLPKKVIKERVQEAIDFVNLTGMEKRFPSQLSGGQQQRVALSRSLVLKPKVLLLDEPLAALDRKLRKEMQTELKRIQREVGITFLNVTHDQKEALSMSDKIAVMNNGKVAQIGTPTEIYESPESKFVASFIGATNIFSGKAAGGDSQKIQFETDRGEKFFVPIKSDTPLNQIDGFSIHPEMINLKPHTKDMEAISSDEYSVVQGRVKEIFYQGDFSEMTIQPNQSDALLSVHLNRGVYCNSCIQEGDEITAYWDWRHNNVLLHE